MRRALARHDDLVRKAVERNEGVVFKTVGDSFFCAFERPDNALRAAVEAQFALANEPWPAAIGEILVRMGLHSGVAVIRRGDYFGPTLNRVARLTGAAHGGQILLSAATATLVSKKLGNATLRDLGTHRLKDLGEPEVIFQVVAPGIRADFLSPASLDATPNNLPSQISSFIGRSNDLERLRNLTAKHPLVTIAGLGGIGKTRLALQLAAEAIADYKDGCWFVGLKDMDDPAQIAQTVADALRLRSVPGEPIEAQLFEYLFKKRALIVIDNAEHLIQGVAAFTRRLLQAVSELRVVVTSREPLHIVGEQVLRIGGLDESERLFIDRARALRFDLTVSDETARSVSSICAKLQGIPLAIELAAARVATLSVSQIDELLAEKLPILAAHNNGDSTENPLVAMVDWSYRLLAQSEKRFLARLAVFDGSFSLDAARSVAFDNSFGGDAFELIASLVDKSLVSHVIEGSESRYHLLEVVRDFANDRLRASGDAPSVERRYCSYYGGLVRSLASSSPSAEATVLALTREWGNVRNALRFALDERIDLDGGRWLVRNLWEFWLATGRTTEGWYWINRALEETDQPPYLRAELLQRAAQIASDRRDFAALEPLAKLLVEIHERSGDAAALGNALQLLTNAKVGVGSGAEAETYQRRALEQFRMAGDRRGIAYALANLGTMAEQLHLNYDTARQLLLHSLQIFRELGVPQTCAVILGNLSVSSVRAREYVQALTYAKESLTILLRLGNLADAGIQYVNIAEILIESRKPGEALPELRAARRAFGQRPNRLYMAYYFEAAFKAAVELKEHDRAALIYGYVEHQRSVARTPLQPSERTSIESRRGVLSRTLPAPILDRLLRDGASMETEAAEALVDQLGSADEELSVSSGDLR